MSLPTLAIVIPCYDEEAVLPVTHPLFKDELTHLQSVGKISSDSFVLFVNDGSKDRTWQVITELCKSDHTFRGISLSRNRGHQNALLAGLMEVSNACDISISIDCDGQDDINVMEQMVDAYVSGCDVVYGVRSNRETDTFFKRFTAQSFYKLLNKMGVESVYNHADYRLLSRRALHALEQFEEVNLFLRGMIPLVGFTSTSVYYERKERLAGESHYPLSKMLRLAIEGITSLSIKPIRMIFGLGVFFLALSIIGIIWAITVSVNGQSVAGWASMMTAICLFGGIQLLSIGVIGEYVGKTYLEVKRRPRFIISERTDR